MTELEELKPIKAIVIEDDAVLRDSFVEALNAAPGIVATSAPSIVAGARAALKEPSLVLLVDLSLPDAKREEAVVILRQIAPLATIVVITGADDDVQQAALLAGAHEVIQKAGPHSYGAGLVQTIREAVTKHESQLRFKPVNDSISKIQAILDQIKVRNAVVEGKVSGVTINGG